MLKFFRQTRHNLLVENKTSKYIKYAVGEIVLVVIGILIAPRCPHPLKVRADTPLLGSNYLVDEILRANTPLGVGGERFQSAIGGRAFTQIPKLMK